jgi:putative ABC transport system permease protein
VVSFSKDLLLAARRLLRDRSLSVVAGLTLTVGIGLNLVVFSFLDAAILRPLPFKEPSRVVHVGWRSPVTYDAYRLHLRGDLRSLEGLLASIPFQRFTFRGSGGVETVSVEVVSDNYFAVLGTHAVVGRLFAFGSGQEAASTVVVSHAFWQRALGGDPAAIGRPIQLDQGTFIVTGVAEAGFTGVKHLHATDVWCRIEDPQLSPHYRSARVESLLGRLAPGVSPPHVQQELTALARRLGWSDSVRSPVEVSREGDLRFGDGLLAVVGLCLLLPLVVLVMACANVSMLIMARSEGRTQEIATRLALGGSRWQLVRQLLTETLLLAVVAGVVATGLTALLARALPALIPANLPSLQLHARIDWRLAAAMGSFSLLAALAAGLSPAIRGTDIDLVAALKNASGGRRTGRLRVAGRTALITTHMAVSIAFLVVTGLLAQGARDMSQKTLGFSPENRLVIRTEAGTGQVAGHMREQRYEALASAVGRVAGVRRVSLSREAPFDGDGWATVACRRPGERPADERALRVASNAVDPRFFEVLGIPIVEGRAFTAADDPLSARVAIVSRNMAGRMWPGRGAIGQELMVEGASVEIVGVAGDIEGSLPARLGVAPPPCIYFPAAQSALPRASLIVQVERDGAVPGAALLTAPFARAEHIRPLGVVSLPRAVEDGLTIERSVAWYLASMGLLALLLAASGIYNLIAYDASKSLRAIGIRQALGASPGSVIWMMLRRPCVMVAAGTLLAWPLALLASRGLASVFYGMKAPNVVAFAIPPLLLMAAVIAAGYFPAHSASRMDPMKALRGE